MATDTPLRMRRDREVPHLRRISATTVVAAQRGDRAALELVLTAATPYARRICWAIAPDQVDEATQETLLVVFRNLVQLRQPETLKGWIRRIAIREAGRIANAVPGGAGDAVLAVFPAETDLATAVDVRAVLERLSSDHRAILVLRDVGDLPVEEVAHRLGVSPGTVKSRLHRARAAFAREWRSSNGVA